MKFSRGKPEPLSKLMTSVMRIAETISFFYLVQQVEQRYLTNAS